MARDEEGRKSFAARGCGFGCPAGECVKRDGALPSEATGLYEWRTCGGKDRRIWPKAGGLEDQPAAIVYVFGWLDVILQGA